MLSDQTIVTVLPWLAFSAPLIGAFLVYWLIPGLFAFLDKRWVWVLIALAAIIFLLLETRP